MRPLMSVRSGQLPEWALLETRHEMSAGYHALLLPFRLASTSFSISISIPISSRQFSSSARFSLAHVISRSGKP